MPAKISLEQQAKCKTQNELETLFQKAGMTPNAARFRANKILLARAQKMR